MCSYPRVKAAESKSPAVKKKPVSGNDDDIYNASTDEEDNTAIAQRAASGSEDGDLPDLPDLPDFFSGKHFLLYGQMSQADRRQLTRYIVAYDG